MLGQALALMPPDSVEAGWILPRYGMFLSHEFNDYEGAQEAFRRGLDIAKREKDIALEVYTLSNVVPVDGWHGRYEEALENALRVIDLCQHVEDPVAESDARFWACNVLGRMGELEEARVHASALLDIAEKLRVNNVLSGAFVMNGILSFFVGNFEASRRFYDRGLEVDPKEMRLLTNKAALEYEMGELEQGALLLNRLSEVVGEAGPTPTITDAFLASASARAAYVTGADQGLREAERTARKVLSTPNLEPFTIAYAWDALAVVVVQTRDRSLAQECYEALASGEVSTARPGTRRLLGLLSHTMGKLDDAAGDFERAVTHLRRTGHRVELAHTCHSYAATLAERNEPGDIEHAKSLLEEALVISQESGMKPLEEKIFTLQTQLESLPPKAPIYPDGLTQREVEVLRLIAGGKTDREIADELIISIRTVGRHVSNILGKTNTNNRTEAATYAATHGLVEG
jgi:DNA-binding CsgD family transcriptional regulator